MPKRLIATLVAEGSLMLAAPADAQTSPQLDPTCQNGNEGPVNVRLDLQPLARVTVRLLCVN